VTRWWGFCMERYQLTRKHSQEAVESEAFVASNNSPIMKRKATSFLILGTAALCLATAGWAKTYTLRSTSVEPGATGTVDAKPQKAGANTEVMVKVDHLAKPAQLTPAANNYVVWIQPNGGKAMNQGVLKVGENEKGSLKMTTTSPKFAIIITAENEQHPQSPSGRVILRTDVAE
jgi:hypothetical protein